MLKHPALFLRSSRRPKQRTISLRLVCTSWNAESPKIVQEAIIEQVWLIRNGLNFKNTVSRYSLQCAICNRTAEAPTSVLSPIWPRSTVRSYKVTNDSKVTNNFNCLSEKIIGTL